MSEQEKIVMKKKHEEPCKNICQEDCCCCDHCVTDESVVEDGVECVGEWHELTEPVNVYVFDFDDFGGLLRLASSVALFASSVALLIKSLRKE